MRIEMLHPMMVHFTIGLLVTGVLMALVDYLRPVRWRSGVILSKLMFAGPLAIWVGAAFCALAVTTGLIADSKLVEDTAIGELVDTHETLAFITLSVFAAVAVGWLMYERAIVRIILSRPVPQGPDEAGLIELARLKRFRPLLHLLGVIGVALVLTTAYYGGEMVYNHGAGVYRDGWPVIPPSEQIDKPGARYNAGGRLPSTAHE